MVVGKTVMPTQNIAAVKHPRQGCASQDPGGGDPVLDAPEAVEGPSPGRDLHDVGSDSLPPALARLVAVARHGNMATLPPSQRHLVARVLLCTGGGCSTGSLPPALVAQQQQLLVRRQRRLVMLVKRLQQRDTQRTSSPARKSSVFKEPLPPGPSRPRTATRTTTPDVAGLSKRKHDATEQWIPVPATCQALGGIGAREAPSPDDQWRPVKMGRLGPPSSPPYTPSSHPWPESPPCPSSTAPCPPPPRVSPDPRLHTSLPASTDSCNQRVPATCVVKEEDLSDGVLGEDTSTCPTVLSANPKPRDVRRRVRRRRAQRGPASRPGHIVTSLTPSAPNTCCFAGHRFSWLNQLTRIFLQEAPEEAPTKEAEGEAAAKSSPTYGDDSSIDSSSKGSGLATPTSPSVVTGSGMGNPFARAASQTTWGSESSEQKPILAPPKLAPPSESGPTKVSSSGIPVIRPSPLGAARSVSSPMRSGASLFTPPTLTVTSSSPPQPAKTGFKLKPSVLSPSNPFAKSTSDSEDKADSAASTEDSSSKDHSLGQNVSSSTSRTQDVEEDKEQNIGDSGATSLTTSSSNCNSGNNENSGASRSVFAPFSRNGEGSDSSTSPSIGRNSFIFGQNVQSKVVVGDSSVTSSSDSAATTNGENQTGNLFSSAASEISRDTAAATNGQLTTGNLFSEAASGISKPSDWNSTAQSLAESSRELTEKENSQKRKFDQVEVITGEESESNVLQMICKLYSWDRGSWQERGRGILRLNDWDVGQEIHSRLVIRTQGTLIVILNTKVWSDMSVERASNKSVRFTALDQDGQPKIFLAMGSPKDVDLLYNSLEYRVAASRSQTHEEGQADNMKKTKKEESGAESLSS